MLAFKHRFRCTVISAFLVAVTAATSPTPAFMTSPPGAQRHATTSPSSTCLFGQNYYGQKGDHRQTKYGHPRARPGANGKSKRQERVGQLVQTELSTILHRGELRGADAESLDDDLRQRISIVSADVSPDLKQARISISVRSGQPQRNNLQSSNDDDEEEEEEGLPEQHNYNPVVDKRRAYAWLVRNTKPIRHTLAQRMSHMKSCPDLTFVQVDVAAATDVMYLIDKVANGYKRERVGGYKENDMPTGVLSGIDFDEDFDDDDDWEEEDADKFFASP